MEADVFIIGGGAAGTVAALLLAKAGKHCIILEKNGKLGENCGLPEKVAAISPMPVIWIRSWQMCREIQSSCTVRLLAGCRKM